MKRFIGLTNNQLKILALIFMTVDHIGVRLFPKYTILRIIGRLAYPIFAYMIAEGCRYTRNKKRYILTMAAFAAVCQIVYFFAMNSLYQCILVTFTLSIALILAFDHMASKRSARTIVRMMTSLGVGKKGIGKIEIRRSECFVSISANAAKYVVDQTNNTDYKGRRLWTELVEM